MQKDMTTTLSHSFLSNSQEVIIGDFIGSCITKEAESVDYFIRIKSECYQYKKEIYYELESNRRQLETS